jgi:hypothetical protein
MNSQGRSPACPVAGVRSPRCHTSRGSAGWSINQTLKAKFEREVDPEGKLSPQERAKRAEYARRAHMQRLALKSAKARRRC